MIKHTIAVAFKNDPLTRATLDIDTGYVTVSDTPPGTALAPLANAVKHGDEAGVRQQLGRLSTSELEQIVHGRMKYVAFDANDELIFVRFTDDDEGNDEKPCHRIARRVALLDFFAPTLSIFEWAIRLAMIRPTEAQQRILHSLIEVKLGDN